MILTNAPYKARYEAELKSVQTYLEKTLGSFKALIVNDTYQVDDYSIYVAPLFDDMKKEKLKKAISSTLSKNI